jgi:hypothetical protein
MHEQKKKDYSTQYITTDQPKQNLKAKKYKNTKIQKQKQQSNNQTIEQASLVSAGIIH